MPQRPRAFNPQTGEEVEYDGTAWVRLPRSDPALEAIKQQQAQKYPTNAELGGMPGMVAPTPNSMGHQFMQGLGQSVKDTLAGGNTPPGLITGMEDPSWHAMSLAFPVPIAKTATAGVGAGKEAIAKVLGASKARAGENFDTIANAIGQQAGNYAGAEPSIAAAQQLNRTTRATIPGPMRGYIGETRASENPFGNMLTYNEGREMASGAGNLSQFETARTNQPMQHQLKEFARAMDEGNRDLAVRNGFGSVYDSAMKEWGKAQGFEEKAATVAKWGKRALIAAALGEAWRRGLTGPITDLLSK